MRQAAAHHRAQAGVLDVLGGEQLAHRVYLVRLHVDHEVVGCIVRDRVPPVGEQVIAYDGQQQQHHDADADGNDLRDAERLVARDVGEAIAPGGAGLPAHRAGEPHEGQRGNAKHDHRRHAAAEHPGGELPVAGLPHDQRAEREGSAGVAERRARRQPAEVSPDDARRRHLAQAHDRRQREARDQHQAGGKPLHHRQQRRLRQLGHQQAADEGRETRLRRVTDGGAEDRGAEPERHDECREGDQHGPLVGAEAAHDGRGVEMPLA